jgi:hypothetical protein
MITIIERLGEIKIYKREKRENVEVSRGSRVLEGLYRKR